MQHNRAPGPLPDCRASLICTAFPTISSALLDSITSYSRS
jgi:hypothetical protein